MQVWFKTPNPATIEKVDASTTGGVVEKAARLVALVAQNEDGSKMFVPLDYKELMIGTDPNALGRLECNVAATDAQRWRVRLSPPPTDPVRKERITEWWTKTFDRRLS